MKIGRRLTGPVRWAVESVRQRGIAQTVKVAVSFIGDLAFDLRYGTETVRRVEVSSLDVSSTNQVNSSRWSGATKARPLLRLLDRLDLPPGSVFVDIGSGKGRVVLVATQCPRIEKVTGIEFSPDLCKVARRNIERYRRRRSPHASIDIVETDAALYAFERDQNVFFMFDPFNEKVLEPMLANLGRSLAEAPRKVWLLYHSPVHHDVIERSGVFASSRDVQISGADYKVYTTDCTSPAPPERGPH